MVGKGGLPPLFSVSAVLILDVTSAARRGYFLCNPCNPRIALAAGCLLFTSIHDLRFTIYDLPSAIFMLTFSYLLPDYLPSSKGAYCANDLCSC